VYKNSVISWEKIGFVGKEVMLGKLKQLPG
jgi:hypothetical protein